MHQLAPAGEKPGRPGRGGDALEDLPPGFEFRTVTDRVCALGEPMEPLWASLLWSQSPGGGDDRLGCWWVWGAGAGDARRHAPAPCPCTPVLEAQPGIGAWC